MRLALKLLGCVVAVGLAVGAVLLGPRPTPPQYQAEEQPQSAPAPAPLASLRPIPSASWSGEIIEVGKAIQARSLQLGLRPSQEPRLAFGRGAVGRLTTDRACLYSLQDGQPVLEVPVDGPRALLSLADGAFLVLGSSVMQRLEPGKKPLSLRRPTLLPGAQIFADAVRADRVWIFDPTLPALQSYALTEGAGLVALPEQVIQLDAAPGGTLGFSREGVWLYFTAGSVERLGPGGARLRSLQVPELPGPFLVLPARRLDQAQLLAENGRLTRALVTPLFRQLSEAQLVSAPFAAEVGDEGRLLAVLAVAGHGPRFELRLFDEKLAATGRVALPSDEPTGREDWVAAVTRNQQLAVAPRQALVAVGGPERLLIFDARAEQTLSIPSR